MSADPYRVMSGFKEYEALVLLIQQHCPCRCELTRPEVAVASTRPLSEGSPGLSLERYIGLTHDLPQGPVHEGCVGGVWRPSLDGREGDIVEYPRPRGSMSPQ